MLTDRSGCPVTMTDPDALAHWEALEAAFLAHCKTAPDHLAATLAAAPDFALAHAVKGLFLMMLGRRELVATARQSLAAARRAGADTARERAHVDALAAWLEGDPARAAALIEATLGHHPGDALAMKISHGIRFILGDRVHMLHTLDAVRHAYGPDHPAFGYYLGCRAFALEENGAYDCARAAGMDALAHAPNDAWGLHAVAHVYDMTGDSAGGLRWLADNEGAWDHCNNFRYHVWWHKALMLLDQGEIERVLDVYDAEVRAEKTDDYRDISNATSLLMRLELEGVPVGGRWEELADLAERRTDDGCLIFADLHYLLALVGGGRDAAARTLVARIAADGRDASPGQSDLAGRFNCPGTAAAEGLEAFGEGAYGRAFARLATARQNMQRAGGSHAQRDVFERLTIDAGIRAGRLVEAADFLDARAAVRGGAEDTFCAARRGLIADLSYPVAAVAE